MSPSVFLNQIVLPTVDEYLAADDEFRRAFWSVGKFYRTELPCESRALVAFVDDANEMLSAKGCETVSGAMFVAACLGAGDVTWRRADSSVEQLLTIGLNRYQGLRANNRWIAVLSGGNLLAAMPARAELVHRAARGVPQATFWSAGQNGMRQIERSDPLWSRSRT